MSELYNPGIKLVTALTIYDQMFAAIL